MTGTLPAPAGRIDVQFHFSPPFYADLVRRTSRMATDRWSFESALAYMETNDISAGVMSVSAPGVDFLPPSEGVALAQRLNDEAAELARSRPGRIGNLATLPMLDADASLSEIDYCLDELEMDGVCMMSNVRGRYPGHESFAPIFDELNRRKAVVLIHPTDVADDDVSKRWPLSGWPLETYRAAIDLIWSGTIGRCPDMKVILAHAAEALPVIAGCVAALTAAHSAAGPAVTRDQAVTQIAGFYYDLARAARQSTIGALLRISGLDRGLFACDWPVAADRSVEMNIRAFEALRLTRAERHAVERGNAARLFPRLAGSFSPTDR